MILSNRLCKISRLIRSATFAGDRPSPLGPAPSNSARIIPVAQAWAQNSVNATIFRRNSLVTHDQEQYTAFYGPKGRVMLAKRSLDHDQWEVVGTCYKGNVRDAHNSISLMVDGAGLLHLAWDQHNTPLRYCQGRAPGSLELGPEIAMTGHEEDRVSYPEFYRLPDGDLIFFYRHGAAGRGDIMLNRYDRRTRQWTRVQDGLIDGQGERNAYVQAAVDRAGVIHLSWVWRESEDAASNHDLCYAQSPDGGQTWLRSDGGPYRLPITAASAEYAWRVPQQSSLMNQTSMAVDAAGNPCIATYWAPQGSRVPRYFLVYRQGEAWQARQVSRRTTPFVLGGRGTKRAPLSRPLLLLADRAGRTRACLVFRDRERGDRVSLAVCPDLARFSWRCQDLTQGPVDAWEPTHDSELWRQKGVLHLLVQRVGQGDGETLQSLAPQPVGVLEWEPPR